MQLSVTNMQPITCSRSVLGAVVNHHIAAVQLLSLMLGATRLTLYSAPRNVVTSRLS